MKQLKKSLGRYWKGTAKRQPDPFRKARPLAKELAATHSIEIEPLKPGFNVWPPEGIIDTPADEFGSDHYVEDWKAVLERVQAYVQALQTAAKPSEAS